jgi:hypothetical protein
MCDFISTCTWASNTPSNSKQISLRSCTVHRVPQDTLYRQTHYQVSAVLLPPCVAHEIWTSSVTAQSGEAPTGLCFTIYLRWSPLSPLRNCPCRRPALVFPECYSNLSQGPDLAYKTTSTCKTNLCTLTPLSSTCKLSVIGTFGTYPCSTRYYPFADPASYSTTPGD